MAADVLACGKLMLKPSTHLKLDPRHAAFTFQFQAVEAVKALPYAALFHEQGLGKTKIGIDLALEWIRSRRGRFRIGGDEAWSYRELER